MSSFQQYRLTQETAAVSLSRTDRPIVTQLHVGAIVAVSDQSSPGLMPLMVEIESDGHNYALFASDLADRGEPIYEEN